MRIFSMKPGHDGHICSVNDGKLEYSIEAEKDSWPRYEVITPHVFTRAMELTDEIPDVIAMSGWVKGFHSVSQPTDGRYFTINPEDRILEKRKAFGKEITYFASSHERSHIFCSFALSPFPQNEPFYALVWEGNIGAFYRVDEEMNISCIGRVMEDPGNKYAYLYALADPKFPDGKGHFRFEDAGKLMALCSYGEPDTPASEEEQYVIDTILNQKSILLTLDKASFKHTRFYSIGVEHPDFKSLARKHSDAIFNRFYDFAKENLTEGFPLVIGGGCGLNCDWNSAWKASGLFQDVFVPPCTNDSGSAIGTAAEAQFELTGSAKIEWSVYAGEEFFLDIPVPKEVEVFDAGYDYVADRLAGGDVIGWVQGKYEIGPRALGNRSLLANTFSKEIHARLNKIKRREDFRPIAPICMEEEVDRLFNSQGSSPHMLYFQTVRTDAIPAVTHIDGSARLQSVNPQQNPKMYKLLSHFRNKTDFGILCNTSLNFNGTGFINRLSDLHQYALQTGLDGYVVGDRFFCLKKHHRASVS
ncbi:MAG: carbamoyltransferase C-terminal domain-containing protein [Endozoicomonas sp.]|uniref:carbamoyltransferase C-terminal domain-containing protein n=1 Tax=Endozoicomonas sp. TaxID=1892382 RepID=UPI003D9BEF2C